MNTTAYAGRGIEIEDDIVRLRRRQLEYEGDADRRASRATSQWRRRRRFLLARVKSAGIGRRPPEQPCSR